VNPTIFGGGVFTQKLTLTVCPTPTGFGETLMYVYVGTFQGGVCAEMFCINNVGNSIETIRIADRKKKVLLFFFIFLSKKGVAIFTYYHLVDGTYTYNIGVYLHSGEARLPHFWKKKKKWIWS
jgi:hypothetical protein